MNVGLTGDGPPPPARTPVLTLATIGFAANFRASALTDPPGPRFRDSINGAYLGMAAFTLVAVRRSANVGRARAVTAGI